MTTALEYNEARDYSKAQVRLIQRVVEVTVDGLWGPITVEGIERWQRARMQTADGKVGPKTLLAIFEDALNETPDVFPVTTVGAWTGRSSLASPQRDVDFCVAHGINRLDVIVNDHSKWRDARDFDTYTVSRIVRLCELATSAGLEVHLMSWVMPHAAYLEQAAQQLVPLCEQVGARSLMWDAEEPWIRAVDPMPYDEAAGLIEQGFANLSCPMSLTGIVYTKFDELGPLAAICRDLIPQCYATRGKSSPSPERIVSLGVERWRDRFPPKRYVMGLAAYHQQGIAGHTVESAMTASLRNTRAYALDTVVYWSLRQIQAVPEVAEVIRSIRAPAGKG